jgi:hypothetical protein
MTALHPLLDTNIVHCCRYSFVSLLNLNILLQINVVWCYFYSKSGQNNPIVSILLWSVTKLLWSVTNLSKIVTFCVKQCNILLIGVIFDFTMGFAIDFERWRLFWIGAKNLSILVRDCRYIAPYISLWTGNISLCFCMEKKCVIIEVLSHCQHIDKVGSTQ